MNPVSKPKKSEDNMDLDTVEPFNRLYSQICKMPELSDRARIIDQVLLHSLQDLKGTASVIIDQFQLQKKIILKRFDNWIMPIAQDVLDGFLQDAEHLKAKLDDKLLLLYKTTPEEWDAEAKHWAQLYSKWNDRRGLINRILEVVADRTAQLIDKDIQVIKDYQSQSLSHLPQETETFKSVEERLAHVIEEPLKQLMNLRVKAKEHTSLQQASEWVEKLQEQRETYFDQLLMKIDHVMKDVVNLEESKDWTTAVEVEGEIIFMERELHHINEDLTHMHLIEECDKQFLLARLEGLIDHLEDLDKRSLPNPLQIRMKALKAGVLSSISRIEKSS
jgi:predicted amino acid-binding ACT domain protein